MRKYRVGIVGYGGFGQFLHSKWRRHDRILVTAICDSRTGISAGEVPMFQTIESFLKSDIDIVSIATPPSTHFNLAMQAIRKGKHVLIEKPMALDTDEGQLLIDEAHRYGVSVSSNYILRFNSLVRLMKQVTDQQIVGDLLHASVINIAQNESLPPSHWFWDKSVSGGILLEHAVHFFDLIYFISQQSHRAVRGFTYGRNSYQEDRVGATVEHSEGLLATHYHSFCRPGFLEETSVRLVYQYGQFELRGWIPLHGTYSGLSNKRLEEELRRYSIIHDLESVLLASAEDVSRPKGWGTTDSIKRNNTQQGFSHYSHQSRIEFSLSNSKSDVYGDCVVRSLLDLILKIEGSESSCLKDKELLEAISIAFKATHDAYGRKMHLPAR